MSSVIMRARNESGDPMNPHFTIHSEAPGWPDDRQIYHWPVGGGGSVSNSDSWPQHGDFQFGTTMHNGPDVTVQCNGWVVLGPGTVGHVGNRWVLNCKNQSGQNNRFWISHINNPGGQPGRWEMLDADGHSIDGDVNAGGAHPFKFQAVNGTNMRFTFVWHPAPDHPLPSARGACRSLSVTEVANNTRTRAWVSVSGVTVGRVHYKHGSNERWWPSQNGPGNLGQSNINTWVGPGTGHDPPNNPDVSGAPAQNGETNMTVTKDWSYQPVANSITITSRTDKFNGSSWNTGTTYYLQRQANNTFSWVDSPASIQCFSASCSIQYVDGEGPGGIVLANGRMHIHGTYRNTSPPPDNLGIWNPALKLSGSKNDSNNGNYTLWESPPKAYTGYDYGFDIVLTAPNEVTADDFKLTPIYFNGEAIGSPCDASATPPGGCVEGDPGCCTPGDPNCSDDGCTPGDPGCCTPGDPACIPVFRKFKGSVSASSSLSPTIEHPNKDDYKTTITLQWDGGPSGTPDHNVNIFNTSSEFYKLSGGVKTGIASNTGGTYPASSGGYTTDTLNDNYNIPNGSYRAGDEFCAHIHADYTSGWVGPYNNVLFPSNPKDASSCPRVVNEPYFKVYNSDISAGGDFGSCTTSGGTLAGYADISDPPGATRGSTTQLSALALLKITGVASAKTSAKITGSPTKLTFANTGVQVDSAGNESPVLGGQFGGCRTLTDVSAPASTTESGSVFSISGKNGAYEHKSAGNVTVNGGTLGAGQNVSLFVDGDVRIGPTNITYGDGWQAGTAPSLVVHATGNIYVDRGVTHLAGLYIAKKKIYTCANGFNPVSAVNLYNDCRNQLVVTGSFVAKQVNLMRTLGSLRDEEPNPGTPGGGTPNLQWSSCGIYGHPVGGESCLSASPASLGLRCTNISEPSDPDGWQDNVLCVPNSSDLHLAWTHASTNSSYADPGSGWASLATLHAAGYNYCTKWDVPPDYDNTWHDNWLCSNKDVGLHFTATPTAGQDCTKISEIADHDGQWDSGYYLCAPTSAPTPPTPKGPPFTACSNRGSQPDTISCAGEIFQYSPTLYLSDPATQPPGDGALQFQSITSLPPVL